MTKATPTGISSTSDVPAKRPAALVAKPGSALDLLHEVPLGRAPSKRLSQALTFGFARGEEEERLVDLAALPPEPSTFRADCFSRDLFLDELISGCFSVEALGRSYEPSRAQLRRLFLAPPGPGSVRLRQTVLAELEGDPERARSLEAAYAQTIALRRTLAGADAGLGRTSHLRRRLEILVQVRRTVEVLSDLGAGARSALSRARDFSSRLLDSDAYQRLVHLLTFEDRRTVLEGRLSLGYDGTLRHFEIVRVERSEHQAFPRGSLGRFWRSIFGFFKGYRFSEDDILSRLLDQVFGDLEPVVADLLGVSVQLEFYLASLGFRRLCQGRGYDVCLPSFHEGEANASQPALRRLQRLFNPWLVQQGVSAVPYDDEVPDGRSTLILTGPNSGGKTRYLQALAVSQLLGQVGTYVPAQSAELLWVDQIFLSLLDHADAAQEEGRLGMELLRIRRVFETSGPRSLIVMDELCSGTNPSEGEQIFDMVLGLLEELRPQVLISTHFLDFAARLAAEGRPHLSFRQVELGPHDVPTYRFVPGVAKTSLAHSTATRLGVTKDELLRLIETHKRAPRPG